MSKLNKKLKRELAKNPLKTGVLAVVCLIAVCYWAPLLSEMLGGPSQPSAADLVVQPTSMATITPLAGITMPTADTLAAELGAHSWKQIATWIAEDPLRQTAQWADQIRNPFAGLVPEEPPFSAELEQIEEIVADAPQLTPTVVEPGEELADEPEAEVIDLERLALTLKATVTGRQGRFATVNGKTYRQGQDIVVEGDEQEAAPIRLRLIAVYPRYVVLQHESGQRRLEIEPPRLRRGDEIALVERGETPPN